MVSLASTLVHILGIPGREWHVIPSHLPVQPEYNLIPPRLPPVSLPCRVLPARARQVQAERDCATGTQRNSGKEEEG